MYRQHRHITSTVRAFALGSFALLSPASAAPLNETVPNDVYLSVFAEVHLQTKYRRQPGPKALAVGPGGLADQSARSVASFDEARRSAITRCERQLKKSTYRTIRNRKCHLYAVGDEIVFRGKRPEWPLGNALPGQDLPLKQARYNRAPKSDARGILLWLHGCDRLNAIPSWVRQWFNHFRAKGFRVIAPDSFAEPRLPPQCDWIVRSRYYRPPSLRKLARQHRTVRFRAAQTIRSVQILQKRYPGLPILVWGHSGGGVAAKFITSGVAGVLSTGTNCIRSILVPWDKPHVVMIGSKDPILQVPNGTSFENVRQHCRSKLPWPEWDFVYLRGVGHFPSINNRRVRKAVDKFIARSLQLHGR